MGPGKNRPSVSLEFVKVAFILLFQHFGSRFPFIRFQVLFKKKKKKILGTKSE